METVLSFYTTRVPLCYITEWERRDIKRQMEKTVNTIDLAVNVLFTGWYRPDNYKETAESEYLLLFRLVDKIRQRR